uniref:MULE transposase domain-containing protein n=1 Tax=Lactuca sativa TaxID=4236 RepID=A0A9R1WVJ8_LACSA|nr:hypothetical protein LSAT_V11C800416280 [Lactuca sativa]
MALSEYPTDRNFIVVNFHYNVTFAPNPLVYVDPDRQSVGDVDFSAFEYEEFMEFLQKLTSTRRKDIYSCLPQESLSQRIHTMVNDGDYKEFLDLVYANERRVNVYVDHYNELIFEWIEEEENEDQDYSCEEDEDSILSDTYSVDHEEDDAEYPFPPNKTMGDSRVFKFGSIVTYKWLGKQFMSEIIEKPKMSVRKMKAKVSTTFNINVSVGQCINAKKFALQEIKGSIIEHYGRLLSYGHEILRTNPGSIMRMDVDIMPDSTTLFSKHYVCFKAGIVRGEVLAVVWRDAKNHIYFIAWTIVGVENKATWKWFIDLFVDDINGGLGAGITLLSDGHRGLLEAVKERWLEVEHRQCARHIVANFAKRFTGQHFRKLFWRAVKASTE